MMLAKASLLWIFYVAVVAFLSLPFAVAVEGEYCLDERGDGGHYVLRESCTFKFGKSYNFRSLSIIPDVAVTLEEGVTLNIDEGFLMEEQSQLIIYMKVQIYASNVTMAVGSKIDGDYNGYTVGKGPGSYKDKYGGGGGSK